MLMCVNAGICARPMDVCGGQDNSFYCGSWRLNSGLQACALFPAEPPY